MAGLIYGLCTLTSLGAALLLLRSYLRNKSRLLLWSSFCFLGLSANNFLVILDKITFPDADLSTIRLIPALIGIMTLLFGLIWENE